MPLNHTAALLAIATPNFDQLVEFYQQLLNQSPVTFIPNVYAEFHLPGVKLGIFRPKGADEKTGDRRQETGEEGGREDEEARRRRDGRGSVSYLPHTRNQEPGTKRMSLCLEVESLEGAIAHLTQLGYPPTSNILTASHGREIYADDPDGNWLILHQGHK